MNLPNQEYNPFSLEASVAPPTGGSNYRDIAKRPRTVLLKSQTISSGGSVIPHTLKATPNFVSVKITSGTSNQVTWYEYLPADSINVYLKVNITSTATITGTTVVTPSSGSVTADILIEYYPKNYI